MCRPSRRVFKSPAFSKVARWKDILVGATSRRSAIAPDGRPWSPSIINSLKAASRSSWARAPSAMIASSDFIIRYYKNYCSMKTEIFRSGRKTIFTWQLRRGRLGRSFRKQGGGLRQAGRVHSHPTQALSWARPEALPAAVCTPYRQSRLQA
jgi:hypothetical protein